MLRPLLKAGKWNWRVGNHMTERRQLHIATRSGSGFEPDSKCSRLWQEPEGWTIACEPSLHAAETSHLAAFRVKVPIQFSNSSRQLTPSLPGIAVRRTASLPLAYARQSIFFENGLPKIDGCPGHPARRRASRFCPGMTSVDISTPDTQLHPRGAKRPRR